MKKKNHSLSHSLSNPEVRSHVIPEHLYERASWAAAS